ncbi:hybrid sensor histidine kinase/response regulator [Sphingobacterium corticibacterium]|uniref:histidine kinase n=1 Tax=Sphingobacterium corticibacterium TaxID=2484746 RepID=A0A4Q6XSC8_9SPHI|nr:hybrid sensor histidine kinase/response regulator [Sphingobacterium corticibacterium]RZF59447.1 hybrid sensor histidine kinase/response regulator [Sphingobacterium corticibacterium]
MEVIFSNYSILIVDDNEINVMLLQVILEEERFHIYAAASAEEALAILDKNRIDLILMDVMMPEVSGFELTEKLKSTEKLRDIPILFITALNSPNDIIKGFDLGACDYVTKPFNQLELVRRIKHQISLIHSRNIIIEQKDRLKETMESRDLLYSIVSHDLRSPISSLKMILNILSSKAEENQLPAELVDMLYSGSDIAEQLFCLLDNLLKWTKSNMGIQTSMSQAFMFDETITGVIEVLLPTAKLKDVAIHLQLQHNIEILFDVDVMKSILRNLIINAIKFSHQSGNILINLYADDKWAVFEVTDHGVGMSIVTQDRLRAKIYGTYSLGTAREGGTGLGLWIVQHFVTINHGEFYFRSKEGEGSCFGFKIPRISSDEQILY